MSIQTSANVEQYGNISHIFSHQTAGVKKTLKKQKRKALRKDKKVANHCISSYETESMIQTIYEGCVESIIEMYERDGWICCYMVLISEVDQCEGVAFEYDYYEVYFERDIYIEM